MKKEEILNELTKEQLLSIHKGVTNAKETTAISKENFAATEMLVREEIAKANSAFKKDGTTPDVAVAPVTLVQSALEVKLTGKNKLRAKLDLQEEILAMMTNGNIPAAMVSSYEKKMAAKKESENDEKDAIASLKSIYPAEIVDAIALIVAKKIKDDEEQSKSDSTAPKSNEKNELTLETVKGILQILNEK